MPVSKDAILQAAATITAAKIQAQATNAHSGWTKTPEALLADSLHEVAQALAHKKESSADVPLDWRHI